MENYARQCIATLKAENAALQARLDKAHAGFRVEAEKLYESIRELTAQLEEPVEEYAAKLLCVAQMADGRAEAAQAKAETLKAELDEAKRNIALYKELHKAGNVCAKQAAAMAGLASKLLDAIDAGSCNIDEATEPLRAALATWKTAP